ncbi:hypothetical protein Tco_0455883 [Tanacetum coccineum]
MFDPPSEEDAIWKLPHQQQILNWRYFHSCSVHCLTVEAAHIYMLTEVKYPLPPRVCKAMLEKKLLGDRKDEVIQNGNSKKRILTGKDGVVRILPPVSATEIDVVEKERKARTILLMAIPKEHMRRFHGMDDEKEIWEAIRTSINKMAKHKLLRSLPHLSNLAMTMRTKPDVDTYSIDDLYNNLRVFEQELTSTSKSSASAQNVAFVSHSKSSTNKVKSGHTGPYSTYTPTSLNNIQEREVLAGFADEAIYSLFAKQSEDLDLLHEDLEQIDDMTLKRWT